MSDFAYADAGLRKLPQSEVIAALQPLMRPARFNAGTWGSGEGENPNFPLYLFDERGNRYDVRWFGLEGDAVPRIGSISRWLTPAFDPDYPGGVYGAYVGYWREDGTPLEIRFEKQERHAGWFFENLEWIGPLAVSAFAFFGPGLLAPYTVAADAAATAASGGTNLFDAFDEFGFDPTINAPPGEFLDFPQLSPGDFMPTLPDVAPPLSPINTPAPPPISTGPGWTLPNIGQIGRDLIGSLPGIIRDATTAARGALTLVQTVRAIQSGGNGMMAGGVQRIVRPDGTVLLVYPDGRRVVQRPSAGTAEQTPDGGFVVNNGDGTYTRVGPDGSRTVLRYGAGQAGGGFSFAGIGSNQMLLIGGAALAAFLLARSFRK